MNVLDVVRRASVLAVFAAAALSMFASTVQASDEPQSQASAQSATIARTPSRFENLSLFAGLDGSKQPQDLGINANMGVRFSANWGFPLISSANLGGQVGVALNLSDAAVHVLDQIEGTSRRTQTYFTLGVFQRPSEKVNWSFAYDRLIQEYYDNFQLGQVRGQLGYGVTNSNEVGVWFAKGAQGDSGQMAGTAVRLDPISQVNAYTKITWASQAQTTLWLGVADGHNNVVWVFPDNSRSDKVRVYGAELHMPLNDRFAVTGAANFLTPTSTGTVDAYLGIAFFPGRSSQRAARNTYAPPTTVANSPTFPVNLSR